MCLTKLTIVYIIMQCHQHDMKPYARNFKRNSSLLTPQRDLGHVPHTLPTTATTKGTSYSCYNAKSSMAVIFGYDTRKLLFLGVRNKFCSACTIVKNRGSFLPDSKCYRNWSDSSTGMESDIITEGFRQSEAIYGLWYMSVIGDGDSSVMAIIRACVLYGIYVEKIECANHACLTEVDWSPWPKTILFFFRGKGGLTQKSIQRLTIGARVAIRMHYKTGNVQ